MHSEAEQPPTPEETREITPEELEKLIEDQRAVSEHVGCMDEQMERYRVTQGVRVDDVKSEHFRPSGPQARERQIELVVGAKTARKYYDENNRTLTREHAEAIADECIVAIMCDLWLSEAAEGFLGVTPPDFSYVPSDGVEWHSEAAGLLCYRAWQVLMKTRHGRETMLECRLACTRGDIPEDSESYEAIRQAIVFPIMTGRMPEYLQACLEALPVGEDPAHLSVMEKSSLLSALREKGLDWTLTK